MNKFGIFKIAVAIKESIPTVTFGAVSNPVGKGLLTITADSLEVASIKASELLKTFGEKTHSLLGDPDTVLSDFPNYFVGQIRTRVADIHDTDSLAFRIHEFTPVKKVD